MDGFNGSEELDKAVARASFREASGGAKVSANGRNTMANALKFHTVVRGKTLPLPDLASDGLSSFEGKRVEVIVVEDEAAAAALPPQQPRRFGTLAGQFVVPDDFDAPLRAPKSLLAVLATLTPLEEELPQFVDLPLDDVNL